MLRLNVRYILELLEVCELLNVHSLAAETGISVYTAGKILRGEYQSTTKLDIVSKLCEVLNCYPDEIVI